MLDAANLVSIKGGLTADPEEIANGKGIKFSIAVDYAGSEGGRSATGYFDVIKWMNPEYDDPQGVKWVRDNLDSGKLKKGSRVAVLGRLVHERWNSGDKKGSRVSITASTISWAGDGTSTRRTESATEGAVTRSEPSESVSLPAF